MESLQELFPDVDSDELLAIYESTDRNVEAAVELLLSNAEERLLSSQRLLLIEKSPSPIPILSHRVEFFVGQRCEHRSRHFGDLDALQTNSNSIRILFVFPIR